MNQSRTTEIDSRTSRCRGGGAESGQELSCKCISSQQADTASFDSNLGANHEGRKGAVFVCLFVLLGFVFKLFFFKL